MSRQRETGRRWPFASRRSRRAASQTVGLLDSISLTAIYTDPTPPETAPSTTANDLLARVSLHVAPEPEVVDVEPRVRESGAFWPLERARVSWRTLATGVAGLALAGGGLAATLALATSANPPPHVHVADSPTADRLEGGHSTLHLVRSTTTPAPASPQVAFGAPTAAHEVFGYVPYWSLPQASQFPANDLSTIAYFSVDVNPNGSIDKSGPGWAGYQSQDLTNLVNSAHQAGDRVVLTATDFSQTSLDALTHDPSAGVTLGRQLTELVKAKNLDGVNLDFEGTGSADQAGLDHLVSQVDFILHTTDQHYQLTMATYASSAGDSSGFYDIAGLSKWVNAFFVMAYDVNHSPSQSNGNASSADASYISQYIAAAGASKVILGLPLFGYDEPTSGSDLGDSATGPSQAVTYAQAMASGPTYWDAATQTAWTSYQAGGQWHQVFFDNVNTIADRVQLAAASHLLGVGAWALGMEGDDDSVLSVLDGGTSPQRTPPAGPSSASAGNEGPGFQASGNSGTPTTTAPSDGKHKGGGTGAATTSTTVTAPRRSTTTTAPPTTTTTSAKQSTTTSSTTGGTGAGSTSSTSTTGSP
jgi:hypothetical protein